MRKGKVKQVRVEIQISPSGNILSNPEARGELRRTERSNKKPTVSEKSKLTI